MKKLILILTSVFLVMAWLAPASAQDPYSPYRYAKWQGIWQEEPVESTVGGDAWMVNGKWVTGHFTRNGVWVRPRKAYAFRWLGRVVLPRMGHILVRSPQWFRVPARPAFPLPIEPAAVRQIMGKRVRMDIL